MAHTANEVAETNTRDLVSRIRPFEEWVSHFEATRGRPPNAEDVRMYHAIANGIRSESALLAGKEQ